MSLVPFHTFWNIRKTRLHCFQEYRKRPDCDMEWVKIIRTNTPQIWKRLLLLQLLQYTVMHWNKGERVRNGINVMIIIAHWDWTLRENYNQQKFTRLKSITQKSESYEIFSKLTIKKSERRVWRLWRRSGNFIVNFDQISHFFVFLLMTFNTKWKQFLRNVHLFLVYEHSRRNFIYIPVIQDSWLFPFPYMEPSFQYVRKIL